MFDHNAINRLVINRLVNESFEATADAFADAQTQALNAEIYEWDGTITHRKSGEIVGSPRDAVDTGELENSLIQLKTIGARTYLYLATHALDVHEGYVTPSGNAKPARRWTEVAYQRFINLEAKMAEELRQRLQ